MLTLAAIGASVVAARPGQGSTPQHQKSQWYPSPDGNTHVIVAPAGRGSDPGNSESRIEFYAANDKLLCALDYSSEDGEHGFGVAKAAWTADSQYFVFSLTSSGGHQPWHAPTQFYSRASRRVRTLDDYLDGAGITNPDFKLAAPNIIRTEILLEKLEKEESVSIRLDTLRITPKRRPKPFLVTCTDRRVLKLDGP